MNSEQSMRPLSERVFEYNPVTLPWIAFLCALFILVGRPLAGRLVVYWVKGADAYSRLGVRIQTSKHPLHFTDGTLVPQMPYLLASLLVFAVISGGLSLLLIHSMRFYERHFKQRSGNAP